MAAITKKTTIGEVLARDINTAKYFWIWVCIA